MDSSKWYFAGLLLFLGSHLLIQAGPIECSVEWEVDWDDIPERIEMRDYFEVWGPAWNTPHWLEIAGLCCLEVGPRMNADAGDDSIRSDCELIFQTLRQAQRSSIHDVYNTASEETGASDEYLDLFAFSLNFHGTCSALRSLLGKPVSETIDRLKNVCLSPMTDKLESLSNLQICDNLAHDRNAAHVVDILDILSNSSVSICRFFSRDLTHDDFTEKATTIIDNAAAFFSDMGICEGILTTLAEYVLDNSRYFRASSVISGPRSFPGSRSSRRKLCRTIIDAFDPASAFVPTPHVLPVSFRDYLDVAAASLRSATLSEGILVFCDVFVDVLPKNDFDAVGLCDSIRASNFAAVENICHDFLHQRRPTYRGITIPLPGEKLILYYFIRIGWEVLRSAIDYAPLDRFFESGGNLQSLIRLIVDTSLESVLPFAHTVCEDYWTFYDEAQELYEMRQNRDDFPLVVKRVTTIILAHFGFSSRTEMCEVIAEGIRFPFPNEPTDELVEKFEQETLAFLTDERRCMASAKAVLSGLELIGVDKVNHDAIFKFYTGYSSISAACKELKGFFSTTVCNEL